MVANADFDPLVDLEVQINEAFMRIEVMSVLEVLGLEHVAVANSVISCLVCHGWATRAQQSAKSVWVRVWCALRMSMPLLPF